MIKFILLLLVSVLSTRAELVSQCPKVLSLSTSNEEPGTYNGVLTLTSDYDLKGTWIRVVFDKQPAGLTSSQGEAVARDDGYLIKNPEFVMKEGVPLEVPFKVSFQGRSPVPSVTAVRLNGRIVCPEQPALSLSPCPAVFSYDHTKHESGKWYGSINLQTEYELSGIWLRIILNNKADFIKSDFGEVIAKDNTSYLLKNPEFHLKPNTPMNLPFFIQHSDTDPKPTIAEIRLNGRTICEKK